MTNMIFMYWDKGFDNAPDVVKSCLQSWKHHHKDNDKFIIVELDDKNLNNYIDIKNVIPNIENKNITKTSYSDIIRILLLKKYGGFWIDSTVFCIKPLNEWLDLNNDFFAFENKHIDHIKTSSWFLYSEKNSYIINKWCDSMVDYVSKTDNIGFNKTKNISNATRWRKNDKNNHYFWLHYLFTDIYNNDILFRNEWNKIKKISSYSSHYIQYYGFHNHITDKFISSYKNISPIFKLTYKYDSKNCNRNSIINYLINLYIPQKHISIIPNILNITNIYSIPNRPIIPNKPNISNRSSIPNRLNNGLINKIYKGLKR